LEVKMVRKRPGGNGFLDLRPGADGLVQLRAGEEVKFRVEVGKACYVGVWSVDAGGKVTQLFPNDVNEKDKDHHFQQDQVRVVPDERAEAGQTRGEGKFEWVWVQASTRRWDPEKGQQDGPFRLFQNHREQAEWAERRRGIQLRPVALAEAVVKYRVGPPP
jgi:hypothetical protein